MNIKELIASVPESAIDPVRRYESIRDYLNERPLKDNPEPQKEVPASLPTISEVFALCKLPDDLPAIKMVAEVLKVGQSIAEATGVEFGSSPEKVLGLLTANGLSQEAVKAISARLKETVPDPAYKPQIQQPSIYEKAGGIGNVTLEQIQEALN